MGRAIAVRVGRPFSANAPIGHGRQINASNTGLNYNGIDPASLTTQGSITYSTDGQTITGKAFTGSVSVTGNNVTIRNCSMLYGGLNSIGISISGANCLIEGVLITAPNGQSLYEPVLIGNNTASAVLRRCDIAKGGNTVTNYGNDTLLEECYGHDNAEDSNPGDHTDVIELYGGSMTIRRCNLNEGTFLADAVVNIAPWQASNPSVAYCIITDSLLGPGGQEIILIDHQAATGGITNVQVLRCDLDQGTNPDTGSSFGVNRALTTEAGHPIVETLAEQVANPAAIYWPHTSGPDVSRWVNATGVTPDWSGLIVVPPQSHA